MRKSKISNVGSIWSHLNCTLVKDGIATNTNGDVRETYPVDYKGPQVMVPHSAINSALKISKVVTLEEGNVLMAGGVKVPFTPGKDMDGFYRLPDMKDPVTVELPGLQEALKLVKHAMAKQDVRYYLNGFLLEFRDGVANVVTTDGHRLAMERVCDVPGVPDSQHIIPRDALAAIDSDTVTLSDKAVIFGDHIYVNKIAGRFPDYRRVIPTPTHKITVDAKELLVPLKQAVALKPRGSHFSSVKLVVENGKMQVLRGVTVPGATEKDKSSLEYLYVSEVACNDSGEAPFTVGLNVDYIVDAINSLPKGSEVSIGHCGDPHSSIFVNQRRVVMSMRL